MGKSLTYLHAQTLQAHLFSPALSNPGALYVLSHLTEKDLTTIEIIDLFPAGTIYKGNIIRTIFYLLLDGLVDSDSGDISKEDTKWSINNYGRKAAELAREIAKTLGESRIYRMKNLPEFPK